MKKFTRRDILKATIPSSLAMMGIPFDFTHPPTVTNNSCLPLNLPFI